MTKLEEYTKKRAEQLGMPNSTAQNRMKKNKILQVFRKHGEDKCYHCGNPILTMKEMVFDHITPWLDNDVGLFWDSENIVFAHISCSMKKRATRRKNKK
jgi:hypothetical protein